MITPLKLAVLFTFTFVFSAKAALVEVLPQSYTFDRATDCGTYCYHDETGVQLIDGIYGSNIWQANLGNGPAYEWLGWTDRGVSLIFDFGNVTTINQIVVGTVQDHINDVVFPSVYAYTSSDGVNYGSLIGSLSVPESSANDQTHGSLTLSGFNQASRYFMVDLAFSFNGPWTFADEVDFYQTASTPVPAPQSLLLLSMGLLLITLRRKLFFNRP